MNSQNEEQIREQRRLAIDESLVAEGVKGLSSLGGGGNSEIIELIHIRRLKSSATLRFHILLPGREGQDNNSYLGMRCVMEDGWPQEGQRVRAQNQEVLFRGRIKHDEDTWHIEWVEIPQDKCGGHDDQVFTCDLGNCKGCTAQVSSGGIYLCESCAEERGVCNVCSKPPFEGEF